MYVLIQRHKKLAATIIAVASISFLFWMFAVSDIKQMFGMGRCVAQVEGECITLREFNYELLKYPDLLEREETRDIVRRQVLYSLITREVLYKKALKLGIVVSDREVANMIKDDPSFWEGERFSMKRYRSVLEGIGITPAEYEDMIRKRLAVEKLLKVISAGVYLTEEEKEFHSRISRTRFIGKLYLFSEDTVSISYEPTGEEMERFYMRNKDRFAEDPKKVYVLWRVKEKKRVQSIYASLKEGNVPRGGKEITDLSGLPREVVAELERLERVGTYTVSKVGDTYYVAYLKDVEPPRIKPFSEVKEEIRDILMKERRKEVLEERAREVADKLRKGEWVGMKPLSFDSSSLDEFIKLFGIGGEESIRLVFSKDKVFGPYRTPGGFAVVYIEKRTLEGVSVEEEELREAKERALVEAFIDKVVRASEININEDYLR